MNRKKIENFLDYKYWKNAVDLINHELILKERNPHFFTFNSSFYKFYDKLKSEKYFSEVVNKNSFYLRDDEFYFYKYFSPKKLIGRRPYIFFSLQMKILYYSMGLYIFKLCGNYLLEIKKFTKGNISSYYGAGINYQNESFNYKNIYYRDFYLQFRKEILTQINSGNYNYCIRLDIENFFENVSVRNLMNILEHKIAYSTRREYNYNDETKEAIIDFFNYINCGLDVGISQSDNNVISSLISHIYLTFFDVEILDILKEKKNEILGYKIIRYVDDIYIFLDLTTKEKIYCVELVNEFSEILFKKLGLKFNNKLMIVDIKDKEEVEDLKNNLKFTSLNENFYSDEKVDAVNDFKLLTREIEKINGIENLLGNNIDKNILNMIYDEKIKNYMESEETKQILESLFNRFNISLLKYMPSKAVLILLINNSNRIDEIIDYVKQNTKGILEENLIRELYVQMKINGTKVRKDMKNEVKLMFESSVVYKNYNKTFEFLKKLDVKISIIEQIRLLKVSEYLKQYSIALNHMCNIIIELIHCLYNSKKNIENISGNDIKALIEKDVGMVTALNVHNLFSRRNNNAISHSSEKTYMVIDEEYLNYRDYFLNLMGELSKKIDGIMNREK